MKPMLEPSLLTQSVTGGLFRTVEVLATTGSTNADAAAAARAGAEPGLVIVAEHQASGRGRLARSWETPPGLAVACSALVAPRRPVADWGWLPLVVGLAVTDGVQEVGGVDARLKWPNDVLIGDRKLCGILCESVLGDEPLAVLGFGINMRQTAEQLPVPNATSLRLEGSDATPTAVLAAVLNALERRLQDWDAGASLLADYRARCSTIGLSVAVHQTDGVTHGTAVDVDAGGGLVVEVAGVRRTFVAGDVVHLRPAE